MYVIFINNLFHLSTHYLLMSLCCCPGLCDTFYTTLLRGQWNQNMPESLDFCQVHGRSSSEKKQQQKKPGIQLISSWSPSAWRRGCQAGKWSYILASYLRSLSLPLVCGQCKRESISPSASELVWNTGEVTTSASIWGVNMVCSCSVRSLVVTTSGSGKQVFHLEALKASPLSSFTCYVSFWGFFLNENLMQLRKKTAKDQIWVRLQWITNFAGIKPGYSYI